MLSLHPPLHLSIADFAVDMRWTVHRPGVQRNGGLAMIVDVACFSVGLLVYTGVLGLQSQLDLNGGGDGMAGVERVL